MANFTAVAIDRITGNNAPVFYLNSESEDENKALEEAKKMTSLSNFERWNVVVYKGICYRDKILSYAKSVTKPLYRTL